MRPGYSGRAGRNRRAVQRAGRRRARAQTPEENAAFAALRRRSEAAEKEAQRLKSENDALLQKHAAPDEARRMRETAALRELDSLRRWRDEKIIEEDIAMIREAYPDFQAKSAADLPEQFLRIMATGHVDPLTAYDICTMQKTGCGRSAADPGAIENASAREKDYYTPEEVDRLTDRDFQSNPRLLDIVQRSMTKWR